mgnify:CR=1 FL=1
MENPRRYGDAPYNIVVIHGGPGAPGEMAPVAKDLPLDYGVLEPFQTYISKFYPLHSDFFQLILAV